MQLFIINNVFIFTFITKFLLLIDSFFCVKNKKAIGNANSTDRNKPLCFQVKTKLRLNISMKTKHSWTWF